MELKCSRLNELGLQVIKPKLTLFRGVGRAGWGVGGKGRSCWV